MADIFISYKKEDAGRVIRIVEALRAEGFSVWWDHGITPGAQWDQTIQAELTAAKVVMAIWSEQSVTAPWVKEEASVGKNRGVLLPVRIDPVEPPLGFSLIQMGDLVGWSGDRADPHWAQVLGALRALIRGEQPVGLEAPRRVRKGVNWAVAAAAAAAAAAAVLAFVVLRGPGPTPAGPPQTSVAGSAPAANTAAASAAPTPSGAAALSPVGPPPAPAAPAAQPVSAAPTPQEQALWDQAAGAKTRAAYQTYLIAYPNGAFAARARDVLLTCRTEMRETWRESPARQVYRGVSEAPAPGTASQGCAAARTQARATAEGACRAIADNPGFRNPRVRTADEGPCDCRVFGDRQICTADPSFTCTYEQAVPQQVEVCG